MQFRAPPSAWVPPSGQNPAAGGVAAPGRGGRTDHAILVLGSNSPKLARLGQVVSPDGRESTTSVISQKSAAIIAGRPCPYPYSSGGSAVRKPSTVGNNASIICTSAATRLSHNSLQNCNIATLQHCSTAALQSSLARCQPVSGVHTRPFSARPPASEHDSP